MEYLHTNYADKRFHYQTVYQFVSYKVQSTLTKQTKETVSNEVSNTTTKPPTESSSTAGDEVTNEQDDVAQVDSEALELVKLCN